MTALVLVTNRVPAEAYSTLIPCPCCAPYGPCGTRARFYRAASSPPPPRVFLGAAENPCVPPHQWRADRLAKKVSAGADFIQTNYVYDIPLFREFMKRVCDQGLHEKVFIMVGVGPLASARAARWMRSNVPGIHIPDEVIERVEKAQKPGLEGKKLCIDLIQQIREVEGVAGVHVMAYRREHLVHDIIEESGLLRERLAGAGIRTSRC